MDRLRLLETFVHVAQLGSLAEAGRRLDLPRGVVSKHLAHLEESYGVRLLNRTTRKVSLTEAGKRLLPSSLRVLAAWQQSRDELDAVARPAAGLLRVAAPIAFTEMHLSGIIRGFTHRYPAVNLELRVSEAFEDIVESGFDVAIRISRMEASSLVARPLAKSPLVFCASPAYLRGKGPVQELGDLGRHTCLGYANAGPGGWEVLEAGERRWVPVAMTYRTNSNMLLRELALEGHGIAQLPMYLVHKELAAGALVTVLDAYRDDSRVVHALYPHRRHLPAKVRAFVDHLSRAFEAGAPWLGG